MSPQVQAENLRAAAATPASQRPERASDIVPEALLQQARRLDEFFAEKQRRWDALTPDEQAREEAGWEQVMRNLDERQRRSRGIVEDPAPR